MAHLFGRDYTKAELLRLVGDMSQLAAVRRAELTEGNERGAGLIEVSNASGLSFSVLPGRAMDIAAATYQGRSLCFRSATGDVGPAFFEPAGYGWMRSFFGGLLISCGLTFVGHPETDPEEEGEELGLHGRLSAIPAREVSAGGSWQGDQYRLRIAGTMREAVALGTTLELRREITTTLGERRISIHDRVENLGGLRSPLMLLYHTNPGFPLLDEGTRFLVNSQLSTEWLQDRPVDAAVYERARAPRAGRRRRRLRAPAGTGRQRQRDRRVDQRPAGVRLAVAHAGCRAAAGHPVAALRRRRLRDRRGAGQLFAPRARLEPQARLPGVPGTRRRTRVPPGDHRARRRRRRRRRRAPRCQSGLTEDRGSPRLNRT